jgi:cation/acetate symporter
VADLPGVRLHHRADHVRDLPGRAPRQERLQFYAAGRSVSGIQNGWAIAGDYLSAASFLGIAGLISLYGYDGFMYSVGWLVAYITVLLVIAEPCRNIGKYTLGDILAFRNDPKKSKTVAAISTIVVSIFYLTAQMVGGGVLVKTLIGIDYEVSVIAVGVLMLAYVVFGGMVATTWVQIIKAVLLVAASLILVFFTWMPYGFSLPGFLEAAVMDPKIQAQVAKLLGDPATNMTATELGQRFLEPGLYLKNPIDQISLGMALVLGTAGMPHILMRFFTVPTAKDARTSVIWAMAIIGGFYVLTLFLGLGAAMNVGQAEITAIDAGGNMAGPLLAQYLGGGAELDARQSVPGIRCRGRLRHHRRGGRRPGAGLGLGDEPRHLGRRGQGRTCHAGRGSPRRAHLLDHRRHRGDRHRHPRQGPERGAPGGAGLRGGGLVQPAGVLLTLYWRAATPRAWWLGMIVGALSAIGLVMVSPNMTYPIALRAGQPADHRRRAGEDRRRRSDAGLPRPTTPPAPQRRKLSTRPRHALAGAEEDRLRGGQRHQHRRPQGAADLAEEPGHHLDPAGLPLRAARLPARPREALRGDVGRTLRAPEHRHPRRGRGFSLIGVR